jgi:hypothetical protein
MSAKPKMKTTVAETVRRLFPLPPPEPAADCDVCAALVGQRGQARDKGDLSAATDAVVEIRNHPHRTLGGE